MIAPSTYPACACRGAFTVGKVIGTKRDAVAALAARAAAARRARPMGQQARALVAQPVPASRRP